MIVRRKRDRRLINDDLRREETASVVANHETLVHVLENSIYEASLHRRLEEEIQSFDN